MAVEFFLQAPGFIDELGHLFFVVNVFFHKACDDSHSIYLRNELDESSALENLFVNVSRNVAFAGEDED